MSNLLMSSRAAAIASIVLAVVAIAVAGIALHSDRSSASPLLQGDTNCDESVNATDALWALRDAAGLDAQPCTTDAGDVDCSGEIDATDAIIILEHSAGLEPGSAAAGECTPIGEPLGELGTPSPTATATPIPTTPASPSPSSTTAVPSPTPTVSPSADCSGPGGGASLPGDPGGSGSPSANSYSLASVLDANYLGAAAGTTIEFALMPGHPNKAIVATQAGYIYLVTLDKSAAPQLWGDLHGILHYQSMSEEGLLSVAFSPDFENDCRVYAYYTRGASQPSILARFTATPTDLKENTRSELLDVTHPHNNHNGGHIAFDNAGLLYLSLGDGGSQEDPEERAQDLTYRNGKVLRIDVSPATGYAIPASNPFQDGNGPNFDDIFALGFRNPFRMTIDPVEDEIWLGDVGGSAWEEVNHVTIGGNYGWDCREGFGNTGEGSDSHCQGKTFILPRAAYDHNNGNGQAITGGVIYRGDSMPELYGWYVYADYYSGRIWAVDPDTSADPVLLFDSNVNIPSFTLAADGEVYVVSYSDGIFRLAPEP